MTSPSSRREFLRRTALASGWAAGLGHALAQIPGERPPPAPPECEVLNPRHRVPLSLIIDDSTCLVNLNRFAMPQFNDTFAGANPVYHRNWRDWPVEIPDRFVREFAEWAETAGVRGKFSIVPYPACVGRLDRGLTGWTQAELRESLEMVRTVMMPRWDIHPEMITHTRVIDLSTGQPYADFTPRFMENWEWTTGRSTDEIAAYQTYALRIVRDVGLRCEGITTPGSFGNRALPQLAESSQQALRAVFNVEVPHYFRHLYDHGPESVAPRVEYAKDLRSSDPSCVVSMIACTGDWTGGWDCTEPGGADKFITADGASGRLVEVIGRGEPALLLAHWTGVYWNGEKRGLGILREVAARLRTHFPQTEWMKLSEIARYWAARELTTLRVEGSGVELFAPFACPNFTLRWRVAPSGPLNLSLGPGSPASPLREIPATTPLTSGSWQRAGDSIRVCFDLPRGNSRVWT